MASHSIIKDELQYHYRDHSQLSIQQLEDVQDSMDVSHSMIQNRLGSINKAAIGLGLGASNLTRDARGVSPPRMGASQNYIANSSKKIPNKFEQQGIVPAIQPQMTPAHNLRK